MTLIDFTPPERPWADYLSAMPPGRVPIFQDIFDRWDEPRYVCPARPRNGSTAQFAAHDKESDKPGHCKCGTPFRKEGLQGVGERHAYLAYLAGMMEPAEAQHFWGSVASVRPERLMELGVLPVVREMFVLLRSLESGS